MNAKSLENNVDAEPMLPYGIRFYDVPSGESYYKRESDGHWIGEKMMLVEELSAIACHMRWRKRQRERLKKIEATTPGKKPTTDEIISALKDLGREDRLRIAQAINVYVQDYESALRAQNLRQGACMDRLIASLSEALHPQGNEEKRLRP
jgi:hypothetical protein